MILAQYIPFNKNKTVWNCYVPFVIYVLCEVKTGWSELASISDYSSFHFVNDCNVCKSGGDNCSEQLIVNFVNVLCRWWQAIGKTED